MATSVPILVIAWDFGGDPVPTSRVNAAELDLVLREIARCQNAYRSQINSVFRTDDQLADALIRPRSFHPDAIAVIAAAGGDSWQPKALVRLCATSNHALSGLPTIDGALGLDGDRVLLTGQTSPAENGPWVVAAGAWSRPADGATAGALGHAFFGVTEGAALAGSAWVVAQTAAEIGTLGSGHLTLVQFSMTGQQGPQGEVGTPILTGTGIPGGGLGVDGQLYLRTTNGDVYQKTSGTWSVVYNLQATLPTYATVGDEHTTLPNARRITAPDGTVLINDTGAGGELQLRANSLKNPALLELTNPFSVSRFCYDATDDLIVSILKTGTGTCRKFNPGSQGAVASVDGAVNASAICFVPTTGKFFIGCGGPKLSILDPLTMTFPVDQLDQTHDYGAGAVHVSCSCDVLYSPSEDCVYGFGDDGEGDSHLHTFDKSTGVVQTFISTDLGGGNEVPPDHANALAYNPGDGDVYFLSAHEPCRLSRVNHLTHAVTRTTTTITGYAAAGAIIFDKNGHLYVFASNASPFSVYKCDTAGAIVATLAVGLAGGDMGLWYDSTLDQIFFAWGSRIGVLDCATFKVLGTLNVNGTITHNVALDKARNKLWCGLGSSGYLVAQR